MFLALPAGNNFQAIHTYHFRYFLKYVIFNINFCSIKISSDIYAMAYFIDMTECLAFNL